MHCWFVMKERKDCSNGYWSNPGGIFFEICGKGILYLEAETGTLGHATGGKSVENTIADE